MLTYEPGEAFAYRLDARAKLLFQVGFAAAAFARPTPRWLATLGVLAAGALLAARLSPGRVVRGYWFVFLLLAGSPISAALVLGPPWIRPAAAVEPLLAVVRVALVLFVGAAYVRSTPVRETRAAVQRHVPGRLGQLLGVGIALTFRFLPVVRRDLRAVREAMRARCGDRRSVIDRGRRLGFVGLSRTLQRADRLSLALQARCFAWNPTLPDLRFSRIDYAVMALGIVLSVAALLA